MGILDTGEEVTKGKTLQGKGGGPKTESIEQARESEASTDPFIPDKDFKEWWIGKFHKFTDGESIDNESIQEFSDYIALNPVRIRLKLEEYGIYETDWEEFVDYYEVYHGDGRIPIDFEEMEKDDEVLVEPEMRMEDSSGLSGMIDNEKGR